MRGFRVFCLLLLSAVFGGPACSNGGGVGSPGGPSSMGSPGATINGALVSEGGSANKHSGGGGSATVPGLVVSVAGTGIRTPIDSADQFVLKGVPGGSVQLVFTAPSLNSSVTLMDVQEGDVLNVGVVVNGSTVALDSQQRQRGSETELEGRIEAVPPTTEADTLIVAGRAVTTNGDTQFFFRGDETADFEDLEVGMRVHVRGTRNGQTMTATLVRIQHTRVELPVNINGIVDELDGDASEFEFMIGDRLITGDSGTAFQGKSTFADLADGKRVEVKGLLRNGSIYAQRIHVHK